MPAADTASKAPVPDRAEANAFFPSAFSLSQYIPPKTDYEPAASSRPSKTPSSKPPKILTICTSERYLRVRAPENTAAEPARFFSTGNHPVETLLPLMHLRAAGYDVSAVATPDGAMAKLEHWAFPAEDAQVAEAWRDLQPHFANPLNLAELVRPDGPLGDKQQEQQEQQEQYAAVFIPGGHGAMINLWRNSAVGAALRWALRENKWIITLCHGPAALLAAVDSSASSGASATEQQQAQGQKPKCLFAGYQTCVFPDSLDKGANVDIGYIPGQLEWFLGERLQAAGLKLVNNEMKGTVHADRKLLTGDSPWRRMHLESWRWRRWGRSNCKTTILSYYAGLSLR